MDEPKQREIDCTSFNFHLPQDRSYAIFDPQSKKTRATIATIINALIIQAKRIAIEVVDRQIESELEWLYWVKAAQDAVDTLNQR